MPGFQSFLTVFAVWTLTVDRQGRQYELFVHVVKIMNMYNDHFDIDNILIILNYLQKIFEVEKLIRTK